MALSPPLDPNNRTWELIAVCAMMLLIYVATAFRLWPERQRLRALAGNVRKHVCGRMLKASEADPLEQRIREECQKRRLQRAQFLLMLSNLNALSAGGFYLLNILTAAPVVNLYQVLWCHTLFAITCFASIFAKSFTPKAVDAMYCLQILGFAGFALLSDIDASLIFEHHANLLIGVLFWGLFDLKPWMNAIGIACIASAETVMLALSGHSCLCILGHYSFVLVVLVGIDYILTEGVRLEVLAKDSNNELTAVRTLLNSICDVIVQLDSNLRLTQHSPKLLDVLLQAPGRNLEGADLRDYMAMEKDRTVFTESMRISETLQAHADVFHAKMRDSAGSTVDMEFFSVAFKGQDAKQHHILGIREYTDIAPVMPSQRQPPPAVEVVMPRNRVIDSIMAGTPAITEKGDMNIHSGGSLKGSSKRSKSSGSDASAGSHGSKGTKVGRMETTDIAKMVTINYMLMGWVLKTKEDACCPLHTALESLLFMLPGVAAKAECNQNFGPMSKWQCQRCGIAAEEHRDLKHRSRCQLCKDIKLELLRQDRASKPVQDEPKKDGGQCRVAL